MIEIDRDLEGKIRFILSRAKYPKNVRDIKYKLNRMIDILPEEEAISGRSPSIGSPLTRRFSCY